MAVAQIFRDRRSNIVLVPWARHPAIAGLNVASGKSISMTVEAFLENGAAEVSDLLTLYETRNGALPSELYEEMARVHRNKFLAQHRMLLVIHNPRETTAQIDAGGTISERVHVPWPLDRITFPMDVIHAFEAL